MYVKIRNRQKSHFENLSVFLLSASCGHFLYDALTLNSYAHSLAITKPIFFAFLPS